MKKYCINLDRRPDRWEFMQDQFDDFKWDVERVPAVDMKPGWEGCRESHLNILKDAKEKQHSAFMVLEDDAQFLWNPRMIDECMKELPSDWDMLYLGASPKEPLKLYSGHLYKLVNAHVTHAIIWHNRKGGAMEYVLDNADEIEKIDDYFAEFIQPMFNCFVSYPLIATQADCGSDIAKHSDVSTIISNYNKYIS